MQKRDELQEYLEGSLDSAQQAALERRMQEDERLCDLVLRQRRTERALRVILAPELRREKLRASIQAAVHGIPMEQLRAEVLSHTSRMRLAWWERLAAWWQELALTPRVALALVIVSAVVTAAVLVSSPVPESALRLAGELNGGAIRHNGRSVAANAEQQIVVGDEIHSGSSPVTLRFDREATTITLEPETTVLVRSLAPQKKFELLQGGLVADVAKQHSGAMLWTTDTAEARVLGTKFALSADGVFTRLDVEKGAVELRRRDASEQTLVQAGEFAAADARTLTRAQSQQAEPVWNVPGRETPGCRHASFVSNATGVEMGVNVLLPPRYDEFPNRRYPVLYFLHDRGGDEHAEAARFGPLLLEAMAARKLPPFIAVFPNSGPGYAAKPWALDQALARDLTKFIDQRYRTIVLRDARTVCGVGQGGHRALMLATMHSPMFGGCGVFDDPLRGGPPGFRALLERTKVRWGGFSRQVLLLHSAAYPAADADSLGGFLQTLGSNVETHDLSVSTPANPDYANAVRDELSPWLAVQWEPQRPR